MPWSQRWQAHDGQEANVIQKNLKLMKQINENHVGSSLSALFQCAQDYLEGMVAGEGVRVGRGVWKEYFIIL